MRTLKGSCHCGAVRFEVDIEEQALQDARRCNCSICRRKGAIMAGVPLEKLRILQGAEHLTLYQWNLRIARHYFCSVCGIYTHHQRRSRPNEYGVNVGCLEDIDPYELKDVPVANGASMSVAAR